MCPGPDDSGLCPGCAHVAARGLGCALRLVPTLEELLTETGSLTLLSLEGKLARMPLPAQL